MDIKYLKLYVNIFWSLRVNISCFCITIFQQVTNFNVFFICASFWIFCRNCYECCPSYFFLLSHIFCILFSPLLLWSVPLAKCWSHDSKYPFSWSQRGRVHVLPWSTLIFVNYFYEIKSFLLFLTYDGWFKN